MDQPIFLILLVLVSSDIFLLHCLDASLFRVHFTITNMAFKVLGLFVILTGIFSGDAVQLVGMLFLVGALPFYLIRRSKFFLAAEGLFHSGNEKIFYLADALGVIMTWFCCWVTSFFFVDGLWRLLGGERARFDELVMSVVLSTTVILVVVRAAARRFGGKDFWENIRCHFKGAPVYRTLVVPVLAGLIFAGISTYFVLNRAVQPQTPLSALVDSAESSFFMVIFVMLAVAVAPFIEEVVFRGYFYRIIEKLTGTWVAVFVIGAIFGLLHVEQYWGDWPAILMVGFLGFMLSWLRAWSGTVAAGITMHYVYNFGVVMLPGIILLGSNPAYVKYTMTQGSISVREKETLLRESITSQPRFVEAYNDLAWLYAEEGRDLDEALALVERALSFEPGRVAYLDTKAEVLEKMGRIDESLAVRDDLLEKPMPPSLLDHQRDRIRHFRNVLNDEGSNNGGKP